MWVRYGARTTSYRPFRAQLGSGLRGDEPISVKARPYWSTLGSAKLVHLRIAGIHGSSRLRPGTAQELPEPWLGSSSRPPAVFPPVEQGPLIHPEQVGHPLLEEAKIHPPLPEVLPQGHGAHHIGHSGWPLDAQAGLVERQRCHVRAATSDIRAFLVPVRPASCSAIAGASRARCSTVSTCAWR